MTDDYITVILHVVCIKNDKQQRYDAEGTFPKLGVKILKQKHQSHQMWKIRQTIWNGWKWPICSQHFQIRQKTRKKVVSL